MSKILFDRIAVRPLLDPAKFNLQGLLFLKPDMNKTYLEAVIIKVGEKVKSSLQKGDVVICDDWLGEEGAKYRASQIDGEKVIFVKEHNIMAKVVEDGNESG